MRFGRKTAAAILSLIMIIAMLPAASFAEDGNDVSGGSDSGFEDFAYREGIGPDGIKDGEAEKLMEDFLFSDAPSSKGGQAEPMPTSIKGDRLSNNDLKYYKYFKSIIKDVSAGKKTSTTKKIKISKFLGKRTFTAKELGVKRIGYKKNGRWYVSEQAKNKINKLIQPKHWNKVYKSLMSDLSSDGYWVDWYSNRYFYEWNCPYTYTAKKLTFNKSAWIRFELPVIPEIGSSTYKVNKSKISDANDAKAYAKAIVRTFDNAIPTTFAGYTAEAIDLNRLWYYCNVIAQLTDYDYYSYELPENDRYWRGPWSLIYVFDRNENTKVVCTGYARALKYLCDLSSFESDWIDCQIVTGDAGESHMWNIVRMNDGQNYVIDPTWMDGDVVNDQWFLRGAPSGDANSYVIEGSYRVYDEWTRSVYPYAERKLSKNDYYNLVTDREIALKGTKIKNISRRRKSLKVKWNKISSPLGALYVDGYQIQYSTKKNFKGAKTVTVKGYAKTAKTIKRLKRNTSYYVRVRTFAKVGRHKYYSKWSGRSKVRTK